MFIFCLSMFEYGLMMVLLYVDGDGCMLLILVVSCGELNVMKIFIVKGVEIYKKVIVVVFKILFGVGILIFMLFYYIFFVINIVSF